MADVSTRSPAEHERIAIEVAREGGRLARAFFDDRGALTVEKKGVQDLVSRADREVEARIQQELLARAPDSTVLGEEGGGEPDTSRPLWVVDPIDGTLNFLRGIPHWCVSIALVEGGRVRAGAVYDPMSDEMWSAHEGGGARLNGARVQASTTARFDEAVIALGESQRTPVEERRRMSDALRTRRVELRHMGAGALAAVWVASGRLDAFLELHLNAWDALAAWHIVQEAGGRGNAFLDGDGLTKGNPLLVSNDALYASLHELL